MVLAAGLYLPLFLLLMAAELKLRGLSSLDGSSCYHLGGAVVIYASMVSQVIGGSIVYTVALLLAPLGLGNKRRRITAIVFATALPLTVIALDLSGAVLLSTFVGATVITTIVYGLACATRFGGVFGSRP